MPSCTSCGAELIEGMKFCGNCGANAESSTAVSLARPRDSVRKIVAIAVGGLCVVVVVVAVFSSSGLPGPLGAWCDAEARALDDANRMVRPDAVSKTSSELPTDALSRDVLAMQNVQDTMTASTNADVQKYRDGTRQITDAFATFRDSDWTARDRGTLQSVLLEHHSGVDIPACT